MGQKSGTWFRFFCLLKTGDIYIPGKAVSHMGHVEEA